MIIQPGENVTCILINSLPSNLSVSKTVTPAGAIANLTVLNYSITLENDGPQILTNVSVNDVLTQSLNALTLTNGINFVSGDVNNNGVLNIGETWIYSASYAVVQSNIDNGSELLNTATVSTDQLPDEIGSVATPITQNNDLLTEKTSSFLLDNNNDGLAAAGDVIRYTYTVANIGNTTLSNIILTDVHNGFGPFADNPENGTLTDNGTLGDSFDTNPDATIWEQLAPGDMLTFTEDYIVVQDDVDGLQ